MKFSFHNPPRFGILSEDEASDVLSLLVQAAFLLEYSSAKIDEAALALASAHHVLLVGKHIRLM